MDKLFQYNDVQVEEISCHQFSAQGGSPSRPKKEEGGIDVQAYIKIFLDKSGIDIKTKDMIFKRFE